MMKDPTVLAEDTERDGSFEQARLDTLETGFLLACYQTLLIALRDRRLAFKHRAVLAVLIEHMNGQTGVTWIGRERIAAALGLASKTVSNAIYELMAFGYILAENRRTPETSGRSLRHYTIRKLSREEVERQLTDAIAAIKASGPTSKVPTGGELQSPHRRGTPAPKSPPAVLESPRRRGAVTNERELTRESGAPAVRGAPAHSAEDAFNAAFEKFWAAFPDGRKRSKGEARDLFRAIIDGKHRTRHATADQLISAAERYRAARPDPQYVPMPSTWLNGGRWEDDVPLGSAGAADAAFDREMRGILG